MKFIPFPVKKSYRFYFIILFLVFGASIAFFTSLVNYNLDIKLIKKELNKRAEQELIRKREELGAFTGLLEGYISSLRNSKLLHSYIKAPSLENRQIVNSLFFAAANTNKIFMQIRYLDEKGMERIRVDWHLGQQWPTIIEEESLQDKSHRYYFVEASQVAPNDFWYSRLDLNVENKKIEVPYKPVLRVASPVYVDQQFKGIVIINCHAKGFLHRLQYSPFFNICLVDSEGYYIVHYKERYSWSRYLQTGYSLQEEYPGQTPAILSQTVANGLLALDDLFTSPTSPLLQHDRAHFIMIPKEQAVSKMRAERKKAALLILATIIFLSIPLSLLISRVPSKLNEQIASQNSILKDYVEIIDDNIITATIDVTGNIIDISSAFLKVSGYSRQELKLSGIGLISHFENQENLFISILSTLNEGNVWSGEIKNINKSGSIYWTEANIFPKFDEDGNLWGHTAIFHDITDKKRVEELSITDELTGLYNRRFFNEVLDKELCRARRDQKTLTFAMLDVDCFKQYNDHYGHHKGDDVLRAIGLTLKQRLARASDYCFRLGGEEFGIIFSGVDAASVEKFADKIRLDIEELGIEHKWNMVGDVVTISMGILAFIPGPEITADILYKKADEALYRAKELGRNRVVAINLGSK